MNKSTIGSPRRSDRSIEHILRFGNKIGCLPPLLRGCCERRIEGRAAGEAEIGL